MRRAAKMMVAVVVLMQMTACNLKAPLAFLEPQSLAPEQSAATGTHLDRGRTLLKRGDYKSAQDAFIRSLRTEGQTAAALSGAGVAAEKQGVLNEARRYFDLAVAAQPNSVIAHNNLGAVLYKMGNYFLAKQAFQSAFALSSGENAVAARNLAITQQAIRREYSQLANEIADPATLQRLGSGEYTLRETTEKKTQKSDG